MSTSTLAILKLIVAKRPVQLSPIVQRRNKLVNRVVEQIELAKAKQEGKAYAPMWTRTVKDETTGESKIVQIPKRVREWFYISDAGKMCISVKYGAKVIEIAKGKNAIELAKSSDLVPTLEIIRQAAIDGELDTAMEAVSKTLKTTKK
jgi:hypothetical protein